MDKGYWPMVAWTGCVMGALLAVSLRGRPGSALSRAAGRAFWAWAALLISQAAGGPGFSILNGLVTAALGVPGYLALWAIRAI